MSECQDKCKYCKHEDGIDGCALVICKYKSVYYGPVKMNNTDLPRLEHRRFEPKE